MVIILGVKKHLKKYASNTDILRYYCEIIKKAKEWVIKAQKNLDKQIRLRKKAERG